MARKKVKCSCNGYYDGPLKDSHKSQEERDRLSEEAKIESDKLTEWPET